MAMQTDLRDKTTAAEIVCVKRPTSAQDVDEALYFQANPDVAVSGQSAIEHFTRYGRSEGRIQYANVR